MNSLIFSLVYTISVSISSSILLRYQIVNLFINGYCYSNSEPLTLRGECELKSSWKYPDPEPIGYCLTDVSPSYLTDGVFFSGRSIGPTHKCVAKQLSAIPRGPSDPVAPRAQVSPRTLERWTVNSKAWYVDNCGRNAKALHGMMGLLPKEKVDPYAGWKSKVALFPRSVQYEYSYIIKARIKNSKNGVEPDARRCTESELSPSVSPRAAFQYTKPPIWWRDKIPNRIECGVGQPNDYAFQSLDSQPHNREEDSEVQLDEPEVVKVAVSGEGEHPKDAWNCDCSRYDTPRDKSLICNTEEDQDLKKAEVDLGEELDPRWHLWHGVWDVPRNGVDRKKAMLNLSRPYLHEINTWYSQNKPTKLLPLLIFEGKRPILQSHFSNL